MYTPTPILLGATTEDGLTLSVTADEGGLSGYVLTGQSGPAVSIEKSPNAGAAWTAVVFPYTVPAGSLLRLTRLDPSVELTTIRALAPVIDSPAPGGGSATLYAVTADAEGFQTISNTNATTDAEGFQTLPDATATPDPDGFESVERTA
ncbi:hypothetical protein [Deinococcus humi]|uniref:Uncharacterized protein n=1 Tax=Deinococcus humi TaxID=662880 RepID=A0A7W8JRW1_9DEIO|nr:hypothetical protein [Deinococcus humi]MBB5362060.1 hypothetical protein [Deinococcus humi]GGO22274.1 hypothetical protein GCM10008949_09350 [Deinococcus humi]